MAFFPQAGEITDRQSGGLIGIDFIFQNGQHVLRADGELEECGDRENIENLILKVVSTAVGLYEVYTKDESRDFGIGIYDRIGTKNVGYWLSELKREITEQLTSYNCIERVKDFSFERERRELRVDFTVVCVDGAEINYQKLVSGGYEPPTEPEPAPEPTPGHSYIPEGMPYGEDLIQYYDMTGYTEGYIKNACVPILYQNDISFANGTAEDNALRLEQTDTAHCASFDFGGKLTDFTMYIVGRGRTYISSLKAGSKTYGLSVGADLNNHKIFLDAPSGTKYVSELGEDYSVICIAPTESGMNLYVNGKYGTLHDNYEISKQWYVGMTYVNNNLWTASKPAWLRCVAIVGKSQSAEEIAANSEFFYQKFIGGSRFNMPAIPHTDGIARWIDLTNYNGENLANAGYPDSYGIGMDVIGGTAEDNALRLECNSSSYAKIRTQHLKNSFTIYLVLKTTGCNGNGNLLGNSYQWSTANRITVSIDGNGYLASWGYAADIYTDEPIDYTKYFIATLVGDDEGRHLYYNGERCTNTYGTMAIYNIGSYITLGCDNTNGSNRDYHGFTSYYRLLGIFNKPHTAEQIAANCQWITDNIINLGG